MGATEVAATTMQSAMSMCTEIRAKAVMLIRTHAAVSNRPYGRVSLRRPDRSRCPDCLYVSEGGVP